MKLFKIFCLALAVIFILTVVSCRSKTPFQQKLTDLTDEIERLETENTEIEQEMKVTKKTKHGSLKRKVKINRIVFMVLSFVFDIPYKTSLFVICLMSEIINSKLRNDNFDHIDIIG